MTLVKVTIIKVIWKAKMMAYLGLTVVISRVKELELRDDDKSLWKTNKNNIMSSTNSIYKVKMKERITLFLRQKWVVEKKSSFPWQNTITWQTTATNPDGSWSVWQTSIASSQPVSNQTWRFTVAPIGLLVNCHLTLLDPLCEHRLKCNKRYLKYL